MGDNPLPFCISGRDRLMKFKSKLGIGLILLAVALIISSVWAANTLNYMSPGGSTWVVGGALNFTGVNAAGGSANPIDYTGTLGIMDAVGTDVFQLFDINLTNANHTGGTVEVMNIANIVGDAQATENAINIGSGWDTGITSASPITVSSALTSASTITTSGNGAIVANKCTVVEGGISPIHQTTVTFTMTAANDIDVADGGKTAGVKFYDMPEGRILLLGATINASVVTNNVYNANPNDAYYVSIGSADGTQAADADLTGTEQDIIPKTTLDTVGSTTLTLPFKAALAASAHFDGTTTAMDLYFNVAVPDAANTGATTHAVTGTLTITWINLGDY